MGKEGRPCSLTAFAACPRRTNFFFFKLPKHFINMPSRGNMSGQEWETVTFSNKKPGGGGGGGGGTPRATEAQKGPGGASTSSGISAAKLENETEELKHQT